jgi:tetratricopeptide (TPR) repeat protein
MATDNPRILELRRRVQADPASIAFAQLAEECRRSGAPDEAIGICRAGLAHHPDYLSARVTLGRALIEVGQFDEAATELTRVVATAPDNLPAIRGLAEVYQQRGDMPLALTYFQRALVLAKHDPDLEDSVERLAQAIAIPAVPAAPVPVEELFDFDTLLTQLGESADDRLPSASAAEGRYGETSPKLASPDRASVGGPSAIDAVQLRADDQDALADMERVLRERSEQRAADEKAARLDLLQRRNTAVLRDLDDWLSAIVADRQHPA